MLDFIVEHIWVLIIIGAIIILTAIGYIVDKFIINKDNNVANKDVLPAQTSEEDMAQASEENHVVPDLNSNVSEPNSEENNEQEKEV